MHEARNRARRAIARRNDDGGRTRARELRSIQGIGEKRDGVGCGIRQRPDAIHDDGWIAVKLTTEARRELT